jgi:hypothetical protein
MDQRKLSPAAVIDSAMMSKKRTSETSKIESNPRTKVSAKESLLRVKTFSKRKDKFVAAVRAGKN